MVIKKVGVIFGGRSVEHDVSIVTACQIMENMNREKFEPVPIYISKEGEWFTGESLSKIDTFSKRDFLHEKRMFLSPLYGCRELLSHPSERGLFKKRLREEIDVAFPAIHGTNGEDGTLQGLLELADIPYTGSGVLGSAVGMDKALMKWIFTGAGLPVLDYYWFFRNKWENEPEKILNEIEAKLSWPLFVKPANLGSSIGISRATNRDELQYAIDVAGHYDRKILVEQGIENPTEINCAVLGMEEDLTPSVCEQPLSLEEFLSFEDKYMRGGKAKGMSGQSRKIPAPISDELTETIQGLAMRVFSAIDARGVARVDFLLDSDKKPYINEINTLPGSISFYLWEAKGIKFSELIERLIDLAYRVHKEKSTQIYTFDSSILQARQGSKF
jgi:D-alanine-D-alanine ligase